MNPLMWQETLNKSAPLGPTPPATTTAPHATLNHSYASTGGSAVEHQTLVEHM